MATHHSSNGRDLPTTRLENNGEFVRDNPAPAGMVHAYALVTTVSGGIEHRPVRKYGTRDGIDLRNFPAVRLFVRRPSTKKAVYDEIDRAKTDAIQGLDYIAGFVATPVILATEQTGAFPGFVKLASGLTDRAEWLADKARKLAAAGVVVTEPAPATEPANPPATEPTPEPATEPAPKRTRRTRRSRADSNPAAERNA